MTTQDKTPIRSLIEAVEGGDGYLVMDIANNTLAKGNPYFLMVGSAFRGSLDAAIALHEALLPGWQLGTFHLGGEVSMQFEDNHEMHAWGSAIDNPARAWLLAILRAYEAQQ